MRLEWLGYSGERGSAYSLSKVLSTLKLRTVKVNFW